MSTIRQTSWLSTAGPNLVYPFHFSFPTEGIQCVDTSSIPPVPILSCVGQPVSSTVSCFLPFGGSYPYLPRFLAMYLLLPFFKSLLALTIFDYPPLVCHAIPSLAYLCPIAPSSHFHLFLCRHTVYEIAHCGVDVTKPRLFTCIVGRKGVWPTQLGKHMDICVKAWSLHSDHHSQTSRYSSSVSAQ